MPSTPACARSPRARAAEQPTLLVVDDADRAPAPVVDELATLAEALAGVPALVLATGVDGERLARLGAADALELEALDAEAVRALSARYAPGRPAEEVPAELLLQVSAGVPRRIHEVAAQWARREAGRRVGAVAGRAAAGRTQLRSMELELASDVIDLQAARERATPGDARVAVTCPFKGLATFEVADAAYFFGRERLVAELVARLVGAPLLAIVGPSGSGKSSALRAGLLPALASGVLPGSDGWTQVVIRPGEHPLDELRAAAARFGDEGRFVLAVDQFEETFTTCRDEQARAAFIAELARIAQRSDGRGVVVLAIRADHYGRCAAYPELSSLLGANHVLVGPMRRDELRRAIECPAQRAGLHVDPELTDALLADVEDEPGALPLLSTALLELWQQRDGRRLRLAAYERTGGVRGAVARLAEEAFTQLDPARQTVARSVVMRLVGLGAAGRGRAPAGAGDGVRQRRERGRRAGPRAVHRPPPAHRQHRDGRGRPRGAAARMAAARRLDRGEPRRLAHPPRPERRRAGMAAARARRRRAVSRLAPRGDARMACRAHAPAERSRTRLPRGERGERRRGPG